MADKTTPSKANVPVKTPIKTIGLFGKYGGKEAGEVIRQIYDFLQSRHLTILLEEEAAALMSPPQPGLPAAALGSRIDLALVIGGDGSMLNFARLLAPHRVPLIGLKFGRLGFLADISTDNMFAALDELLRGQFQAEERFMLYGEVWRDGQMLYASNALNDVVINKGERARLIEYDTYVDGEFVSEARADGIIVSTPTGSTAYALSAGGPILHPAIPAIVLAPICPHTLSNRPIVVSSDCRVEIVMSGPQLGYVSFDGQSDRPLQKKDRVLIRRADTSVILLHPSSRSHYEVLRAKLHWSKKY